MGSEQPLRVLNIGKRKVWPLAFLQDSFSYLVFCNTGETWCAILNGALIHTNFILYKYNYRRLLATRMKFWIKTLSIYTL